MLESLSSLCAGLNSAKSQRREALDTLQVKKEHINQFAQLTVSLLELGGGWPG